MPGPTGDELFGAIEAMRPDTEDAWPSSRSAACLRATLTQAAMPPAPRRRRPKGRTVLIGGVVVALLGSGTAWAVAQTRFAAWYTGDALDGVTCMTSWPAPGEVPNNQYGGSPLSPDPIADCAQYAELTGNPPVEDPVVVIFRDLHVVGPRQGVPADAIPIEDWHPEVDPSGSPTPIPESVERDPQQEFELDNSLDDAVDGGNSQCWKANSARSFARAELKRLGLSGWRVVTSDQEQSEGPCAGLFVPEPGTVEVRTHAQDGRVSTTAHEFRQAFVGRCLTLAEAEQTAKQLLASEPRRWVISKQIDASAKCSRVDFTDSENLTVFLYGP